jgi:hypothetical protein
MDHGQDALMATSSITKLVCSAESSVPRNDSVTVCPAKDDTSKVFHISAGGVGVAVSRKGGAGRSLT